VSKSWSGKDDPHIRPALGILWAHEDDLRVAVIEPHDVLVVPRLRDDIQGCVGSRPGYDYRRYAWISRASKYYVLADRFDDVVGLAMLLHHESFHLAYGGSEPPAYRASLAFLERLDARTLRPDLIADVEAGLRRALAKDIVQPQACGDAR
jgi:hypothetical protein